MGFFGDAVGWAGNQLGITNKGGAALDFDINQQDFQLPQFQQQFDQFGNLGNQFGARGAPQAQTFQAREGGQFGQQQSALSNMLMQQAQGRGPGQEVVRMQAQNAANNAQASAQGMAARAPGNMGALAGRNAALSAAGAQSQVGAQAAMGGLQAQLGATSQLGNVLGQARAQNQNMAQFNASQQQQGGQFNTTARLQQTNMNDQAMLQALQARMNLSGMQQQGNMGYYDARLAQAGAQANQPTFLDKAIMGGATAAKFMGAGAGKPA